MPVSNRRSKTISASNVCHLKNHDIEVLYLEKVAFRRNQNFLIKEIFKDWIFFLKDQNLHNKSIISNSFFYISMASAISLKKLNFKNYKNQQIRGF